MVAVVREVRETTFHSQQLHLCYSYVFVGLQRQVTVTFLRILWQGCIKASCHHDVGTYSKSNSSPFIRRYLSYQISFIWISVSRSWNIGGKMRICIRVAALLFQVLLFGSCLFYNGKKIKLAIHLVYSFGYDNYLEITRLKFLDPIYRLFRVRFRPSRW